MYDNLLWMKKLKQTSWNSLSIWYVTQGSDIYFKEKFCPALHKRVPRAPITLPEISKQHLLIIECWFQHCSQILNARCTQAYYLDKLIQQLWLLFDTIWMRINFLLVGHINWIQEQICIVLFNLHIFPCDVWSRVFLYQIIIQETK